MSKILRRGLLLLGLIGFFLMFPVIALPTVHKPSAPNEPAEVKILEVRSNAFSEEATFQQNTCEVIVLAERQKYPLRMTEAECANLIEGETLSL